MARAPFNVVSRLSNTPSLVSAQHADQLRAMASGRYEEETEAAVNEQCAKSFGIEITDPSKPFLFSGGIAVIPVYGLLLHRDNYCDSWATGYDFIRRKFEAANSDSDVKGIVFDVHSYGGQVSGNFELCDTIFAGRAKKPSMAMVDAAAYSGGYSIASSTGKIVATPSSGIGSIGVVMMHISYEKAIADFGLKVTFIHAGEHKVDGNPYENMSDEVKASFQKSVDKSYTKFVNLVARNRALDTDAVQATEAACFDAEEALALGLIDGISTTQDALASFRNTINGVNTKPQQGAKKMATENTDDKTISQADHDAAVARAATEASTTASKNARERISAIQGSEEAKGRTKLANHIALNTDMSVEDAKSMLAASATEQAASTGNAFSAAMNGNRPEVGADGGDEDGGEKVTASSRLLGAYGKATGVKLDKK